MLTLFQLYNVLLSPERKFVRTLYNITGFVVREPSVYRLAFRHSSLIKEGGSSARECNERLEYLGDAILGAVVSEYLFQKYPTKDEGYLTEMRSKIVGRNSLNQTGVKLGLEELVQLNKKSSGFHRSIAGNTLEALIGAIFLDMGFHRTRKFILKRIIQTHFDLDQLEETNTNYKSQLLEYIQKNKLEMPVYELVKEKQNGGLKIFTIACKVGDEVLGVGTGTKKKNAEQKASQIALERLVPERRNSAQAG